jgi:hypothetical protein
MNRGEGKREERTCHLEHFSYFFLQYIHWTSGHKYVYLGHGDSDFDLVKCMVKLIPRAMQ